MSDIFEETSLHFEIQEGKIIKEIFNNGKREERLVETNPICANRPYGLNEKSHIIMRVQMSDLNY